MEQTNTSTKCDLESIFKCKASKTLDLSGESTFLVVQWNVLAVSLASLDDSFPFVDPKLIEPEYRIPRIVGLLNQVKPDLIQLEEVDFPDRIRNEVKTKEGKNFNWIFQKKTSGDSKDGNLMGFDGSVWSLIAYDTILLSEEPGKKSTRTCIHMKLTHIQTNKILNLYGTHLKAKRPNHAKRLQEVNQILPHFLKPLKTEESVIFLGDLNGDPWEEAIQEIKKIGLSKTIVSDQVHTTAKKRNQTNNDPRQIDYIFYSESLSPVEAWQESTHELGESCLPDKDMPSDHLPIYAKFIFKN